MDVWETGDAYDLFMGRWSGRIADRFLDWLDLEPGGAWLDVGCGTGALTETVLHRQHPSRLTGVEPSEGFLGAARRRLGEAAELLVGGAEDLPLASDSVDVVVSGLVLNFVNDPVAALTEMRRVARPGGTVAVYVWDYAAGMEMLRVFWDAARSLDERAGPLDEAVRFPLGDRARLGDAFASAGFGGVEVTAIDAQTPFETFEEFWGPFEGGQGPAPTYLAGLAPEKQQELRDEVARRLPAPPFSLGARAWAARGTA